MPADLEARLRERVHAGFAPADADDAGERVYADARERARELPPAPARPRPWRGLA